ncbi:MAG: glutathione transferase [Burkholderiales bacterium]|nr:MAG: glutathione transferase [Betaproteobacteria bacterium]TAG24846.1 MAG: glutathione transferase [Burkholderiales bacterium]TAG46922.1 MAG: glutathione transferase [Betaproteobacteria bacterium]
MSDALTLYVNSGYTSPYALAAFVTLKEKNLPFEIVEINLEDDAHHAASYQKSSITERVPTLTHGDFALSESSAICEYLEDAFPSSPRVLPTNTQQRARARQVQAWIRSDLMPIRMERSTSTVFQHDTAKPLSADAQAAAQKLFRAADALVGNPSGNLFDQWCIADVDLAMMLNRLVHNGDAVPAKLEQYVRNQWARPSVQAWVALAKKANA